MSITGYYFITDAALSRRGTEQDVRDAVAAGVEVVQYRHKSVSSRELFDQARVLRHICDKITFLINDRIDIALAVGADGVHLGQDDMPAPVARRLLGTRSVIGITVHTLSEALAAEKAGADYVAISPIFQTATKKDAGTPTGLEMIRILKKRVTVPVVAIGGITLARGEKVIAAGADALCALSPVLAAKNVRQEIKKFRRLFSSSSHVAAA